ncbi:MAG: hypothetical protein ABI210_04770 [Abditibacteriaceae bacterium]
MSPTRPPKSTFTNAVKYPSKRGDCYFTKIGTKFTHDANRAESGNANQHGEIGDGKSTFHAG